MSFNVVAQVSADMTSFEDASLSSHSEIDVGQLKKGQKVTLIIIDVDISIWYLYLDNRQKQSLCVMRLRFRAYNF